MASSRFAAGVPTRAQLEAAGDDDVPAVPGVRIGAAIGRFTAKRRGWRVHAHGYTCPRCGASVRHDQRDRQVHDDFHAEADDAVAGLDEVIESLRGELADAHEEATALAAQCRTFALILGAEREQQ